MNILVIGANGMIGKALSQRLEWAGHQTRTLGRGLRSDFSWDPDRGIFPSAALDGVDAVIHLAGENLRRRWTLPQQERIRASRVLGTSLVARAIAQTAKPPKVLIAASAVGYYGHQADRPLTEASGAGQGFLADLCRDWKAACAPAVAAGVRVVNARMSIILSSEHGVLAEMRNAFQYGMGSVMGHGRQYMGWVSMGDLVNAFLHILENDGLSGPVNITSPCPVRMERWAKTLGRVMGRPVLFKMPPFLCRALFGPVVDYLLLASQNVHPAKLLESGFAFNDPEFEPAVKQALGLETETPIELSENIAQRLL